MRVYFCLAVLLCLTGCAQVNQGLDTANVGAEKVGEPVGKVIKVPQSAAEGVTKGYVDRPQQENPYGR